MFDGLEWWILLECCGMLTRDVFLIPIGGGWGCWMSLVCGGMLTCDGCCILLCRGRVFPYDCCYWACRVQLERELARVGAYSFVVAE